MPYLSYPNSRLSKRFGMVPASSDNRSWTVCCSIIVQKLTLSQVMIYKVLYRLYCLHDISLVVCTHSLICILLGFLYCSDVTLGLPVYCLVPHQSHKGVVLCPLPPRALSSTPAILPIPVAHKQADRPDLSMAVRTYLTRPNRWSLAMLEARRTSINFFCLRCSLRRVYRSTSVSAKLILMLNLGFAGNAEGSEMTNVILG